MPAKRKEEEKFVVRLPKGMRGQLAELAHLNNRSLNSEIVHRLGLAETLEVELDRAKRTIDELLDNKNKPS